VRFLVDTNILFWVIAETSRLSKKTRQLLSNPNHRFWASPLSIAELRIKQRIGKIILPERFSDLIIETGFESLPFLAHHADWLVELPLHHRDPFDRMLVAQAAEEGLTLLTSDKTLSLYPIATVLN
jgi:PIN domain nuclease of toxin-antitoxin system